MPSGGTITPHDGTPAFTFITLKGQIQSLAMVVIDVSRPGVDGHAYRQDAQRGKIFEMLGLADFIDHASAANLYVDLVGYQGQLVDVVDDYGNNGANVMLLEVHRTEMQPLIRSVGGLVTNSTNLTAFRFVMQKTTPPGA